MGKKLFPKIDALLHGCDYNPEQWLDRPDILEEDIRLMKQAHVNVVTLGVFSWSVYEPVEGEYHFAWLKEIMDNLYDNGIYTILATPSAARPAWLDMKYPDTLRTDSKGIKNLHGERHNNCMSSGNYRRLVRAMDVQLAENFGRHPGLIMWHIDNEVGCECWCDACRSRFQEYLRKRYDNDIEKLNKAWWTTFWSHRFNDFDQIDPPSGRGEKKLHGLNLDWNRFTTWNTIDFLRNEITVFKEKTPGIPVTTNFMHLYPLLDYNKIAKELDVISWDSYPRWNTAEESLYETAAGNAFDSVMMRSFKKDQPYMLMESVPNLVNWHEYNKLKRPKVHKLNCIQTLACGSDTVQYFQWRKGRGSYEQYHGAVLDHLGRSDTRVFRDVEEVGGMIAGLSELQGTLTTPRAAIIYDQENKWAVEDAAALSKKTKKYPQTCMEIFNIFMKNGVDVDLISSEEDYSGYDVLVAPMLYLLKDGVANSLTEFVERGGQLVATYFTGYVDKTTLCYLGGFPGDGLTQLFGLYSEEIDTLYPKDKNGVKFKEDMLVQNTFTVKDYCEIVKVQDAQVLAEYTDDFYAGTPAVTVKENGAGKAYYVAARVDNDCMEMLLKRIWQEKNIPIQYLPEGVEYHKRENDKYTYEFYMNYTSEPQTIHSGGRGKDILTGFIVDGDYEIGALESIIVRREK